MEFLCTEIQLVMVLHVSHSHTLIPLKEYHALAELRLSPLGHKEMSSILAEQ
jgi:hypothetical protein